MQRDPAYFSPAPNDFWPDRWLPEADRAPAFKELIGSAGEKSEKTGFVHNVTAFFPFSFASLPGRRLSSGSARTVGERERWRSFSACSCVGCDAKGPDARLYALKADGSRARSEWRPPSGQSYRQKTSATERLRRTDNRKRTSPRCPRPAQL